MATDTYNLLQRSLDGPYTASAPGIVGELANVTRAIYVGGTGNLVVTLQDGSEAIFYDIPAGTLLPIRATEILSGSVGSPSITTTANKMLALW